MPSRRILRRGQHRPAIGAPGLACGRQRGLPLAGSVAGGGHADARVFVSSQNWSTDGTLYNRAAGLIIDQPDAATYFQQFFFYDLDNLSQQ